MFVAEILKTKGNAVFSIAPERTVADACAALRRDGSAPWSSVTATGSRASSRNGTLCAPWRRTGPPLSTGRSPTI